MRVKMKNGRYALLDDSEMWVKGFRLFQMRSGYVIVGKKKALKHPSRLLHRIIMNAPRHLEVDHINGNKLDNRKANLRLCTTQQNHRNRHVKPRHNTSGIVGVGFAKTRKLKKRWRAYITIDNRQKHLGWFSSKQDAKTAYEKAVEKYFKNFKPNHVT